VIVDMALHVGIVDLGALSTSSRKLSQVATFAEPATESPMESRLRMLLVLGGLPRPQAQISLFDNHHRFLGRPDLYYPDHRLCIEYDGTNHRDRLAEDNRRQNLLVGAGFRLLRFAASDIYNRPDVVGDQVRSALSRA